MTDPHVSPRRAARAEAERQARALPRHAAKSRAFRRARGVLVLVTASALLIGGGSAVAVAFTAPEVAVESARPAVETPPPAVETAPSAATTTRAPIQTRIAPLPAEGLPSPTIEAQAVGTSLCDDPAFADALASRDDAAAIAAAGGAEAFRSAVATGAASCVPLDDPSRLWFVVNKQRPYTPVDFRPDDLVLPAGVRLLVEGALRAEAAGALSALVAAATAAGAGEIGSASAFRSYETQQSTYSGHVADRGVDGADLVSARPGFSEHQSGLGVDVVPCEGSWCGSLDDIAGTPQGDWVAAHAWEFGWIVRYEEGRTDVTGYTPEPWHLRYIGRDLARTYHDGGWTTLEEFFGLPPAPVYAG